MYIGSPPTISNLFIKYYLTPEYYLASLLESLNVYNIMFLKCNVGSIKHSKNKTKTKNQKCLYCKKKNKNKNKKKQTNKNN